MSALPTRKDEAWRYSDLAAVARLWPVAVEQVDVPAGETQSAIIVAASEAIRHIAITIGAHAAYRMTILDSGRSYGRIALDVTLHEGADFHLGAVLIGNGAQTIELITTVRHHGYSLAEP